MSQHDLETPEKFYFRYAEVDVDVAFFTQPRQPLPQLGIDAALDVFMAMHYMTW